MLKVSKVSCKKIRGEDGDVGDIAIFAMQIFCIDLILTST